MSEPQDDLPRAHIKRIVKAKLTALMNEGGPDAKGNKAPDGHVQKEALLAFGECAKIFIHILTSTANDICRDGKRQTISVDDVFKAVEELEFGEFGEPLKEALAGETRGRPRAHRARSTPAHLSSARVASHRCKFSDALSHFFTRCSIQEGRGGEVGQEKRRRDQEA